MAVALPTEAGWVRGDNLPTTRRTPASVRGAVVLSRSAVAKTVVSTRRSAVAERRFRSKGSRCPTLVDRDDVLAVTPCHEGSPTGSIERALSTAAIVESYLAMTFS